MEDFGIS